VENLRRTLTRMNGHEIARLAARARWKKKDRLHAYVGRSIIPPALNVNPSSQDAWKQGVAAFSSLKKIHVYFEWEDSPTINLRRPPPPTPHTEQTARSKCSGLDKTRTAPKGVCTRLVHANGVINPITFCPGVSGLYFFTTLPAPLIRPNRPIGSGSAVQ